MSGPPSQPPPAGEPGAHPGRGPWRPSDALLGVLLVLIAVSLGTVLVLPLTGRDGLDLMLAVQAVSQAALLGVAFGLARARARGAGAAVQLGLRRPAPGWVRITAGGYLAYIVAALILASLIASPEQAELAEELGFNASTLGAIAAGFFIVIAAPFAEEIFFRGLFFAGLRDRLPFAGAALISGLVFGVSHLGPANLVAAAQLAILGVVLAWLYEETGSIWPAIAVHGVNNALAFTLQVAT